MNSGAVNIFTCIFKEICIDVFVSIYTGMGLVGHRVDIWSALEDV